MKHKTWPCEHIKRFPAESWLFKDSGGYVLCGIPFHFWNFCPICGAKRPTTKKGKK